MDKSAADRELSRREVQLLSRELALLGRRIESATATLETLRTSLEDGKRPEDWYETLSARLDTMHHRVEIVAGAIEQLISHEPRLTALPCAPGDHPRSSRPQRDPIGPTRHQKYLAYQELVRRIGERVAAVVPSDATVIVVSKGDDDLLRLGGRRGWHFPQTHDGVYAGHHPADSGAAVAHLEELRAKGAQYLVIPSTAFWWLDHYADFSRHLDTHYKAILREEATCVIFALGGPGVGHRLAQPATQVAYGHLIRHVRELVHAVLPLDATVIVVSRGDDDLLKLDGRRAWHFPQAEHGGYAGYYPADSVAAISQLESLRTKGAQFLLFPTTAFWWLEHYADFARHLHSHYHVVVYQQHTCLIFDLDATRPRPRGRRNTRPPAQGPVPRHG